ncbi:MAG: pantetheine-phosphate adenylyltransferase [Thermoplasmatales archaeon]|nr:pantetheine-phosphate adenylyltransferase [Thermoplasmatales archaeon]
MKVCIGGTFDIIHEGHISILSKAFEIGDEIYIGISTDKFVEEMGKKARSYEERKKNIEEIIKDKRWNKKFKILPLENIYGITLDEDFDAIIVSPETEGRAKEINEFRRKKGRKEIKIIVVPYVFANDGIPITTSRIKANEIRNGKRIKPLKVFIGSKNEVKIEAVKEVFNEFFKGIEIIYEFVGIDTKKQPWNEEIIEGAINRAKKACINGDYGVGIESGIKEEKGFYFIEQYTAIFDKTGYTTLGKSPSFQCPTHLIEALREGKELKELVPFKNKEEEKRGFIWYLSKNIDRKEITKCGVKMALLPRKSL